MRNWLFCLLIINVSALCVCAQTCKLEIGKRGNWLLDRKITPYHLANRVTAFNVIFYKTDSTRWRKVGLYAARMKPFFENEPESLVWFRKYRSNKIFSHVLIGVGYGLLLESAYLSALAILNTPPGNNPQLDPKALIFLGGYYVCGMFSVQLNILGDQHLQMAAFHYNRMNCGGF